MSNAPPSRPRVILVTDFSVNDAHGTGVQLKRIFEGYEHILHVSEEGHHGGPFTSLSIPKPRSGPVDRVVRGGWRRLAKAVGWDSIPPPIRIDPAGAARLKAFGPDVVLGVVHTNHGLRIMQATVNRLPGTPAVVWFLDLQLTTATTGRIPELEKLLDSVSAVWTISPEMMDWLPTTVQTWPSTVDKVVVPHWCMPVPEARRDRFEVGADALRSVMLGNMWDASMLPVVQELWRNCQARLPALKPLQWTCRKSTLEALATSRLEPQIEWRGDLTDDELGRELAGADLAIVPFSLNVAHGYGRFSIPSKLGEFAAAGVPSILLAHRETAAAKYVTAFDIGLVLTNDNRRDWPKLVCDVILDNDKRRRLSEQARHYAVRYLEGTRYREHLIGRLTALARVPDRIARVSVES